jgi:hypothetical protein
MKKGFLPKNLRQRIYNIYLRISFLGISSNTELISHISYDDVHLYNFREERYLEIRGTGICKKQSHYRPGEPMRVPRS